jgi:hypothetical protein
MPAVFANSEVALRQPENVIAVSIDDTYFNWEEGDTGAVLRELGNWV